MRGTVLQVIENSRQSKAHFLLAWNIQNNLPLNVGMLDIPKIYFNPHQDAKLVRICAPRTKKAVSNSGLTSPVDFHLTIHLKLWKSMKDSQNHLHVAS